VDDALLFLHVLSAFALMAGVVMFSALALGVPIGAGSRTVADRLTEIGATLALVFGLWIVFREDIYDVTDGWILGAIGLWVVAVATGTMAGRAVPEGDAPVMDGRAQALSWAATAASVGILVLMIWKPGI
jgi:hypothetical protein